MEPRKIGPRTWAIAAAAGLGGLALGLVGVAGAQTSSSSTTAPSTSSAPANPGPSGQTPQGNQPGSPGNMDPATMGHGPNETLLTGDTAEKVKAAALAAVPGGTIIRVETDSDGSPYEAHVRKADGTEVTVKFDASIKATGTEDGFGRGPGGMGGPGGPGGRHGGFGGPQGGDGPQGGAPAASPSGSTTTA